MINFFRKKAKPRYFWKLEKIILFKQPCSEFSNLWKFKKNANFSCFSVEEMDEADEELRQTLRKIWPLKAKKNMIDLVVPPNGGKIFFLKFGNFWKIFSDLCFQKLTVGKIYAGLLILENWRARKSGVEVRFRPLIS